VWNSNQRGGKRGRIHNDTKKAPGEKNGSLLEMLKVVKGGTAPGFSPMARPGRREGTKNNSGRKRAKNVGWERKREDFRDWVEEKKGGIEGALRRPGSGEIKKVVAKPRLERPGEGPAREGEEMGGKIQTGQNPG